MASYPATTRRIWASVGLFEASRMIRSCASARSYMSRAAADCAETAAGSPGAAARAAATMSAVMNGCRIRNRLVKLCIHLFEVILLDEHLARLPAGRRRHEPVHLHHVDQARGATEADAQPPLEVRDRRLSARHDDPRGLVVELVLLELLVLLRPLLVGGDRVVVGGPALLAEEARQARAFLLGDVGAVQADEARRGGRQVEHVALAEQLLRAVAVEN